MVSSRVSPLAVELAFASAMLMHFAPVRLIAASKESLVRVEGSKKSVATTMPSRSLIASPAFTRFSYCAAVSMIWLSCWLVN